MESPYYRDNLEQILKFTGGRNLLTIGDVKRFCGVADGRTVRRRYPIIQGYISAATLARCLSGGPQK